MTDEPDRRGAASGARGEPIDLLVVGWYPAADAIAAGRFVADQVEALAATGRVRPAVVAFENAALRGSPGLRARQAEAVRSNIEGGIRAIDPFVDGGAAGVRGVPLARLTAAAGTTPTTTADHRAEHRIAPVEALVRRPAAAPMAGADGTSAAAPSWQLLHAHPGYPEGAAAAAAAHRLGVPFVVTEHARFLSTRVGDPLVRARYRQTLLAAARVIAVSRVLADEIVSIVPALSGRIVVVPNAVDVGTFRPADAPRAAGELLWVGNRLESKGIETLLRAFALLHRERPTTSLRLIGPPAPGGEEARWIALASDLRIADRVRFEGAASRGEVAAAMARADLFVHPSPFETFGIVAAEALASGLPVVATDSGGVTEVLGDDPDALGAIVPAGNPDALSRAIAQALDRRPTFDPARLRQHVVDRFAATTVAARLIELYEAVLEEAPRRAPDGAGAPAAAPRAAPGRAEGRAHERIPAAEAAPAARTIVVAFSRLELDRAIEAFPAWTWHGSTVVTTGPDGSVPGGRLRPAAPGTQAGVSDLLGWGTAPRDMVARASRRARAILARAGRRATSSDEARLLARLAAALGAALEAEPAGASPPLVVCLSGLDHLVAAPFVASGRATAAPGGLRWLADVRAGGQPRGVSGSADGAETRDAPTANDA